MARAEDYIAELLKLTPEERASAARVLLDSLDDEPADPQADEKKAAELIRRAKSVRDGTSKLIDGDEARKRVMARLDEFRNQ
jgi:putative addiction module component (TIGR02574 family)